MSRLHLITALSAASLLGAAACSRSSEIASRDSVAPAPLRAPATEEEANIRLAQDFVNAAGQAGLVEVEASKQALVQATNPDVKSFAQMMIVDHAGAGKAL